MTFVLKDGEHVIEINMDGFCFHEIITVSGAADLVLFVEDLFWSYYGHWPNVIVLDVDFSAYTSSPLPGSIEYTVYDASECPGPYYESEVYEKDPPYECAYDPVAGPNKYAGELAGRVSGGAGKWHVLMRGSYVLHIASWGFQDVWIEFEVGKGEGGELLYIDDESWWMEWGWRKFQSQITLPAVSSIDGKVSKGDVFYKTFLADEAGSFEFVNATLLASTKWTKFHPGPKYLELDAGSYVIYFKCAGYMYSWTYVDVWWSTNVALPSVLFVPTLQVGQVQFVMQWRYTCMDDDGLMDYETCPKQYTYAPCVNYDSSPRCSKWGSAEVDTIIIPSTADWNLDRYAWRDSPSIASGGAEIKSEKRFSMGGFGETTRFTSLHAAKTPTQEYTAWVNAYYGADKQVSSGGFSMYQVEVSIYCGPDTCKDPSLPGKALPGGRIYSAVLPKHATSAFWWNSGKLSAGGENGNLVAWLPCLNVACALFDARVSLFSSSLCLSLSPPSLCQMSLCPLSLSLFLSPLSLSSLSLSRPCSPPRSV